MVWYNNIPAKGLRPGGKQNEPAANHEATNFVSITISPEPQYPTYCIISNHVYVEHLLLNPLLLS